MGHIDIAPTGGLHTNADPHQIGDGDAAEILNASFAYPGVMRTRPGTLRANTTAGAGAVLAIYEFARVTGPSILVAKIAETLVTLTVNGDDSVTINAAIITGMTAGFRSTFATMTDKLFICDKGANYVYDGTNVTELGRAAPAGITAANGGAGSLEVDGAYAYRFAFYSTSLDQEGEMSAVLSHQLTGGASAIAVTFPAGVTDELDAVWDTVRCYRTAAGGSSYLLEATHAASYTDTTADASLGAVGADSGYTKPPGASYVAEYLGRLWFIVGADPTLVYFSEPGEPQKVGTASTLRCGQQDGDPGLGLLVINARLYVVKRDTLFMLVGADATTFSFIHYEAAGGSEAGHAIVNVGGSGYAYNARLSTYRWRGAEVQRIGEVVRETVRALDQSAVLSFVAGFEPNDQAVWFAVRRASVAYNDRVLVFYLRSEAWSLFDLPVSAMGLMPRASGARELLLGDDLGYLAWASDGAVDGQLDGKLSGAVVSAADVTHVTTTADLSVTGDALAGLWLHVKVAATGVIMTARIVSNTVDTFTLASPGMEIKPETGDVWWAGGILLRWRGRDFDAGAPFRKKIVRSLQASLRSAKVGQVLVARVRPDGDTAATWVARTLVADQPVAEFGLNRGGNRVQPELAVVTTTGPVIVDRVRLVADAAGPDRGA